MRTNDNDATSAAPLPVCNSTSQEGLRLKRGARIDIRLRYADFRRGESQWDTRHRAGILPATSVKLSKNPRIVKFVTRTPTIPSRT